MKSFDEMGEVMVQAAVVKRVVTTEELEALVAAGKKVRVRRVVRPEREVLEKFPAEDVARLDRSNDDRTVASVTHVGEEEVQCISVDHPDHLYLTDDFIPTHNTSNIIFLKSTDDSMIDTLQKMSGTTHKTYRSSKTVTRDVGKMTKVASVEGKVSHTYSTEEEPVISYNDLASLPERNSIVFRAGDSPIWNRNETILPMSWRLFSNTIEVPGVDFSLQTIPTLSSALEFDLRLNQPDFAAMLSKRMDQAVKAPTASDIFSKAYGYGEFEISRLDPDVYAQEVMDITDTMIGRERWIAQAPAREAENAARQYDEFEEELGVDIDELNAHKPDFPDVMAPLVDDYNQDGRELSEAASDDDEIAEQVQNNEARRTDLKVKRYGQGTISREMLVDLSGRVTATLDRELSRAYAECRGQMQADALFSVSDRGDLYDADGSLLFMEEVSAATRRDMAEARAADEGGDRVHDFDGGDGSGEMGTDSETAFDAMNRFRPTGAFKRWLASLDSWDHIAGGLFDREMAHALQITEDTSIV